MSFSVIACYLALLISCPWNTDSSADQKFLLCLAHTKTNMAQPTQQGSLRLSTVLSVGTYFISTETTGDAESEYISNY